MLFSSMVFIFVFLPIVAILYYISPRRFRNLILLVSSIIFYAWGEPVYVFIMLATILINYIGAIIVDKIKVMPYKRLALTLTILADLSILFYFKYFNFFAQNINKYLHGNIDFIHVIMPIGISFYTFQAISYVADVFTGEVKAQRNIEKLALFITFFPQLIAGPIVKYHDICEQIENRRETIKDFILGLKRFIIGLSKKIIIANTLAEIADAIFSTGTNEYGILVAWLGIITYTLQIYFDFSGYSDMAIGLGRMFGFKILENFNFPYVSKTITEFWRRWHISLSTWFKLYLYIPLGGNRCSLKRNCFNILVVFFATGFWHGAAWVFILWGAWYGVFLVIEKITGLAKKELTHTQSILAHIYTLSVVIIGWVFFRSESLSAALGYISSMFDFSTLVSSFFELGEYLDNYKILMIVSGIIGSTGVMKNITEFGEVNNLRKSVVNIYLIALFLWCWSCLAASTYNPFIYFRF